MEAILGDWVQIMLASSLVCPPENATEGGRYNTDQVLRQSVYFGDYLH
jgi:hypothetical protein